MTASPEIRVLTAQPALTERVLTDAAGLPSTIDRVFPALLGALEKQRVVPAGAPFIRYLQTGERFEVELGVPIPAQIGPLDGGEQTTLPAGRAAVLRYFGPYEGLPAACEELGAWAEQEGEQAAGPFWEAYVTDPRSEPDPHKRLTEICIPIR
jgi:GyrI-like small molecule binding domain